MSPTIVNAIMKSSLKKKIRVNFGVIFRCGRTIRTSDCMHLIYLLAQGRRYRSGLTLAPICFPVPQPCWFRRCAAPNTRQFHAGIRTPLPLGARHKTARTDATERSHAQFFFKFEKWSEQKTGTVSKAT